MTYGASLLRAILDDPGSDVARLAYADHLEETGETARAEFIRVQVELARLPPGRPLVWLTDHRVEMLNLRREEEWDANAMPEVFYDPAPSWQITGYMAEEDVRSLPQPVANAPIGTLASQRPLVDVVLPLAVLRIFACHFVRLHLTRRGDGRVRAEFVQLPQYDPDTGEISYPLPCAVRAKHESLRRREGELLAGRDYEWFFPRGVLSEPAQWRFRRGFVNSIATTAADFLAHAAALFAAQPITEVRLVGREPQPNAYGGSQCAWHCDSSEQDLSSWIPFVLLDRLSAEGYDGATWKIYPYATQAHAALSRACVAYGRERAGLPPLSEETKR